jgi:hypothetical protein
MGTKQVAACVTTILFILIQSLGTVSDTVLADEMSSPAVSGVNGKFSGEGGLFDDDGAGISLASISLPLGHEIALQIDGAAGYREDNALFGGGGHLFYRDPSSFLLGAYGTFHSWGHDDIWRMSGEAEFYVGPVSLEVIAGIEGVEGMRSHEHFFSITDVAFYVNENFRLTLGHRYTSMIHVGVAGAEYLFNANQPTAYSIFVDGRFGEKDYERITAGVRLYFGNQDTGSLQYRHRNQDPRNRYPDLFSDDNPDGCPAGTFPYMGNCVVPE